MGKESDIRTFPFGEQMNKGLYSKIKTQRNTIRKQLSAYSASYPLRNENSIVPRRSPFPKVRHLNTGLHSLRALLKVAIPLSLAGGTSVALTLT